MALSVASGSYTGNGSDNRDITGVGFRPKLLFIKGNNSTSSASGQVAIATTGDSCRSFFSVDNTTNEADAIQQLQSDGFQIGTAGSVNTSGTTYYWTAFGGDDVVVGNYSGNNTDNRDITGLGFQPSFLWVKGTNNASPAMRFSGQSGDASFVVGWTNAEAANAIQSFLSDGFQVGTSTTVNASATTYYYAAVKASTQGFVSSTYTGNATDDRSITGVGFTPDAVFIARSVAGRHGIMRSSANSGDDTTYISSQSVNFANGVQALESDGFQIGTDSKVNTSSAVYYYVAAKTYSGSSASSSPSSSPSSSISSSPSSSASSSPSTSVSSSPSPSASPSSSISSSVSSSPSPSTSPSASVSSSVSSSLSVSVSSSPSTSASSSPSSSPSVSVSSSPSASASSSPSPSSSISASGAPAGGVIKYWDGDSWELVNP